MVPLLRGAWRSRGRRGRKREAGCQGWGRGGELVFGGCGASVWEDEKVLEMGGYTAT